MLRPPPEAPLGVLPREALRIDQGFHPHHAHWQGQGYAMGAEAGAAAALVFVPRSKRLARALVAQACAFAPGGLVAVDGQKTDGIDSLFRACRNRLGDLPNVTKGHGRLFWFRATEAFADWAMPEPEPGPEPGPEGFVTLPGVFSEQGVDRGSALLAGALPPKMVGRVCDLGAGWGYLAQAVLSREEVTHLDLVEAEALALDCARLNVTDPRAAFHWADALTFSPAEPYTHIVTNPPFHESRKGQPTLGQGFITAAARMLAPNGRLWLVANRHLPYEAVLTDRFRNAEEIGGDGAFKLFAASRPRR